MLRKSPFFDFLNRHNSHSFEQYVARSREDEHYIDWNGFVLPNDYGDAAEEYRGVREQCGLCDVTPMQKIRIQGPEAGRFLDHLLTRPVSSMASLRAGYTVFCTDEGYLKDDAMLYKLAYDDYLLLPSDVDHVPFFETVCERYGIDRVRFTTDVDAYAGLAVQGPAAAAVVHQLGFAQAPQFKPLEVRHVDIGAGRGLLARMGFTADLGYEFWIPPDEVETLTERIETLGAAYGPLPGYGLTAIQVCRMEGGFIVAGWDCSTEIDPVPGFERSPFELGLGWLVNLDAGDFVGRDALRTQQAQGARHALRYLRGEDETPIADGEAVFAMVDGQETQIGFVTSSGWSWGLKQMIGNVSVEAAHQSCGQAFVQLAGDRCAIELTQKPPLNLKRRTQVPASDVF